MFSTRFVGKIVGIGFIAVAAIGFQSKPTVTLKSSGLTVGELCQQLSQAANISLIAQGPLKNDEIAVYYVDKPLDKILSDLQWTEHARLRLDGGQYVLYRSDKDVQAIADHLQQIRTTQYQASIDHWVSQISPNFDGAYARKMATDIDSLQKKDRDGSLKAYVQKELLGLNTPIGRATVQAVAAIGAKEISSLRPESLTNYSTNPTPAERPIPLDGSALLRNLAENEKIWETASKEELPNSQARSGEYAGWDASQLGSLHIEVIPNRGALAVIDAKVCDRQGKVLAEMVRGFNPPVYDTDVLNPPPAKPEPAPVYFQMDPAQAGMMGVLFSYGQFKPQTVWSNPEFQRDILRPADFNPYAQSVGKLWIAACDKLQKQGCMALKDACCGHLAYDLFKGEKANLSLLVFRIENGWQSPVPRVESQNQDGTLCFRISNPVDNDQEPDFVATQSFLQQVVREKGFTFESVCQFATTCPSPFPAQAPFELAKVIADCNPGITGLGFLNNGDWELKAFYGFLPSAARQLAAGEGLPLAQCPPQALALLPDVFRWEDFKIAGLPAEGKNYIQSIFTQAAPTGVPGEGYVRISRGQASMLRVRFPGDDYDMDIDIERVAQRIAQKSRPGAEGGPAYDSFMPLLSDRYTFDFAFPPGSTVQMTVDNPVPNGAAVATSSQLPTDLRDALDKAIEKAKSEN